MEIEALNQSRRLGPGRPKVGSLLARITFTAGSDFVGYERGCYHGVEDLVWSIQATFWR